jgi:hypothetical protein
MSLLMAVVLMFSTMSFTINMHYCGDNLVETAVFKKAKGCGMEMNIPASEGCSVAKKNCCEDKQLLKEGQNELQSSFEKLSVEQQLFITSFVLTYNNLFECLEEKTLHSNFYSPPLVQKDIQTLYEVYLI